MKLNNRQRNLELFLKKYNDAKPDVAAPELKISSLPSLKVIDLIFATLAILIYIMMSFWEWDDTDYNIFEISFSALLVVYLIARAVVFSISFFQKQFTPLLALIAYSIQVFAAILAFGLLYYYSGTSTTNTGFSGLFDSIYFSFITWSTVGYGDISPVGISKIFAVLEGVMSYIFMALLIAKILKLVNSNNEK